MSGAPGIPRDRAARVAGVLIFGAVCAAGWWSWSAHGRAEQAARRLAAAERSWRSLEASEPVPTAAVAAAWRTRRESLERHLERARSALGAGTNNAITHSPPPAQRADAFFALARFVEEQRAAAGRAGVALPKECAFGFSAYAHRGPADEELALVHRQQQVTQGLLEILWRSGARALTRMQREVPADKLRTESTTVRGSGPVEGRREDYLQLPASRSLARAGLVDTLALRIGFVGKTSTLRNYLNELTRRPLPLVVRSVEVEPLGTDGTARGGVRTLADLFPDEQAAATTDGGEEQAAVPIIGMSDAEFLVTVEYLDFSNEATTPETEATP